mgnify:FL=1
MATGRFGRILLSDMEWQCTASLELGERTDGLQNGRKRHDETGIATIGYKSYSQRNSE